MKYRDIELDDELFDSVELLSDKLDQHIADVSKDIAYFAARYKEAIKQHAQAEIELDATKSRIRLEIRATLSEAGGRVTEGLIDDKLMQNEEYQEARLYEASLEAEREAAKVNIQAILAKREQLSNLVRLRCSEMADPLTRELARARRLGEDR
jgi:hypothetical protein